MQIRDPTVRFSGVVADRRRSRAATCGGWFCLGDHAPDLGRPRAPLEGAVIGASARALTEEHLEQTVAIATPSSGAWSTRSAACFGETGWMKTRSRGSS